jgi:hypothetical protein
MPCKSSFLVKALQEGLQVLFGTALELLWLLGPRLQCQLAIKLCKLGIGHDVPDSWL